MEQVGDLSRQGKQDRIALRWSLQHGGLGGGRALQRVVYRQAEGGGPGLCVGFRRIGRTVQGLGQSGGIRATRLGTDLPPECRASSSAAVGTAA